ncbi:sigma-70 family RNA polymerase sigma factor [Actinospica durhamensis]|uniref:Sigma-70 family RNA polymerase sigma factor n=1 Tax=Actinospica durhamensis TaxID=1508375 RepID=A0A941IW94_9ACTN|nr:sigma-70 family RNA polymerase sigma factor [Actinospica durhamensis]MBR7838811.1 sigma-70 family RNA polymerase sigma factor [Actinospica durhamensis]
MSGGRTRAMDPHHSYTDPDTDLEPPDRELIDRVRGGDLEAFDPLYRRHRTSALRHARYWTRSEAAAEDLSAESFTRVLYAIRNGNGPSEAFRPYLLTAMRNVARDWAEGERRTLLLPDLVDLAPAQQDQDPVIAALERSLAGLAFMSLPERWQTVLWQMEVEREGPTQLAPQLGIDAAAVSALAYRAREGLKQAYLQAHITEIGSPSCRPFAERLGTHTRGKLRGREAAKVRGHLKHCSECVGLYAMLKHVNGNLPVIVAPAVVGAVAAAKSAALWTGGSAAVGAAGGGAHAGIVAKLAVKARSATPRQQVLAAGTTVAVVVAAVAYALSGSPPQPQPAAKPASQPPSAAPAHVPAPPSPSPSPAPTHALPTPVAAASTPPPAPAPRPYTTAPPPPSPTPTPTPSPTQRVSCPNLVPGIDLNAGGLHLTVDPTGLGAAVDLGLPRLSVDAGAPRTAVCATEGPPRPFPVAPTLASPDGDTDQSPGAGPDTSAPPSPGVSPGVGPGASPAAG